MGERRPEDWADAQRELRERYAADPSAIDRVPAHISWRAIEPSGRVRSAASDGSELRIEVTAAHDGDRAMRFPAALGLLPPRRRGRTDAVVIGEFGPNAATGLEVDGGTVWPSSNPVVGAPDEQHRRTEVVRGRWTTADDRPPGPWAPTPLRVASLVLAAVALIGFVVAGLVKPGRGITHGVWGGWATVAAVLTAMVVSWFLLGADSRRRAGPGSSTEPPSDPTAARRER